MTAEICTRCSCAYFTNNYSNKEIILFNFWAILQQALFYAFSPEDPYLKRLLCHPRRQIST